MSKTVPWLAVSVTCCILSAQAPNCPTIEVSIVAEKAGPLTRQISSDEGNRLYLTEKPLLTSGDFKHATVSFTEGQYVLNLDMTAAAARRVQTFTKGNVGKTFAFLVNGHLIRTPKIRDPIVVDGFLIGAFGQDEALQLADSINHKTCRP